MRALVTGGAGFIGRWVVRDLLTSGCEVRVLDDLSSGRRENLAEFDGRPGFLGLTVGDLKDRGTLRKLFQNAAWDRVYHLGASISVQSSIDDPEPTFRNDVEGTFTVLEACREQYFRLNGLAAAGRRFHLNDVRAQLRDHRPRVAVMSTCMVYAPAADATGISEQHPLRATSPYAASKVAADSLSLSYFHAYGLPVTVVRPFNTYGPFQKSNLEGGVVSIFLKRDISREPLLIRGDGTQTRDLLYVEDCAAFVARAAEVAEAEGEIVNAGTGRDIAVRDLAALCATRGNGLEYVAHDHPQAEIARLLCNPSKATRLLGWKPATTLEEGIRRTRVWLEDNRWAW